MEGVPRKIELQRISRGAGVSLPLPPLLPQTILKGSWEGMTGARGGKGHGRTRRRALLGLLLSGVLGLSSAETAELPPLVVTIGVCQEGRPPFVKAGGFEGLDRDLLQLVSVTLVRDPPYSEGETHPRPLRTSLKASFNPASFVASWPCIAAKLTSLYREPVSSTCE